MPGGVLSAAHLLRLHQKAGASCPWQSTAATLGYAEHEKQRLPKTFFMQMSAQAARAARQHTPHRAHPERDVAAPRLQSEQKRSSDF